MLELGGVALLWEMSLRDHLGFLKKTDYWVLELGGLPA